ncbi:hypothetical protein [Roseibium aggregatum]|uniref:Uncharacterized protein n=1 Tax=Roseibium aggregatum TaxID=187304 RepID=A0A926P613_9HYPH|nr:hypothetical protein [Roseibium aggregatum]MBD1548846.1 hypothetical protein [Roseibium aggregatum]
MMHYERSYATARAAFTVLETVGMLVAISGAVAVIIGLGQGSSKHWSNLQIILTVVPGVAAVLFGLISVAIVQASRAAVDTAEMTRELLHIARNEKPTIESPVHPPSQTVGDSSYPVENEPTRIGSCECRQRPDGMWLIIKGPGTGQVFESYEELRQFAVQNSN